MPTEPVVEAIKHLETRPGREYRADPTHYVEPDVNAVQAQVFYAQPPHLFRNVGSGRFVEVTDELGADLARPEVARGAAHADYDGDGDLDLIVTTNDGPARLLRNDLSGEARVLRLRLVGTDSNRDAYGAVLNVDAGGRRWMRVVRGGGSYLSHSDPTVTVGLGNARRVDRVEIRWPSGRRQTLQDPPLDRVLVVTEGQDDEEDGVTSP